MLVFFTSCKKTEWKDKYEYDEFKIEGVKGIIVKPKVKPNGKWIVRPAFIGEYPYVDDSLLNRGYTVGFFNVTHEYGNIKAQRKFKKYIDYCKDKYNLNKKVILEGFSRGGFFSLCYATNYPNDIDKIYIDNPVCNLKSWPLKHNIKLYEDAADKWSNCGYKIDSIYDYPIKNFYKIIQHNIPVVLVYGCNDTIAPYKDNFGLIETNDYKNLLIISKENSGHHPHSLEKCDTIIKFLDRE